MDLTRDKTVDAVFIGWQEQDAIGEMPFPLYNIIKKSSKRFNSTVGLDTLIEENLDIPYTPKYRGNNEQGQ